MCEGQWAASWGHPVTATHISTRGSTPNFIQSRFFPEIATSDKFGKFDKNCRKFHSILITFSPIKFHLEILTLKFSNGVLRFISLD